MTDERDNDQRPSWREIDQRRDRPQRREGVPKRRAKTQAEWLRKLSLRQAEALFKGKQGQPEYQVALRNLEKAHGTKKFTQAAKKFLEEYGFQE